MSYRLEIEKGSLNGTDRSIRLSKFPADLPSRPGRLPKEELDKLGLIQFPMVMGGVVPVLHIKGIIKGKLKLSLALPDQAIVVVHRSDGSGTNWIFTSY